MEGKLKMIFNSFLTSLIFVFSIPTINFTCWEGCSLSYNNSIINLVTSEMAIFSTTSSILINILIVFSLFTIFIFIIEKFNLNIFKKVLLSIIFLIFIALSHFIIFNFFTDDGIEYRKIINQEKIFNNHLNIIGNEMKELKTKIDVEKYIKTQKNFVEVNCENTKVNQTKDIAIFDKNINFEKEYITNELNLDFGFNKINEIISNEIFKPQYIPKIQFNRKIMIANITKAYNQIGWREKRQNKINRSIIIIEQYDFNKVNTQNQKEAQIMFRDLNDKLARINHEENIKFDLRLSGLYDKSYYCNITKRVSATFLGSYQPSKELTEKYYDCIFYVNNNLKTLICFEKNITKHIFINEFILQHGGHKRFYDSFLKDEITIEKYKK